MKTFINRTGTIDLSNKDLSYSVFSNCHFTEVDFTNTKLDNSYFINCFFEKVKGADALEGDPSLGLYSHSNNRKVCVINKWISIDEPIFFNWTTLPAHKIRLLRNWIKIIKQITTKETNQCNY